jgi:penicillin-binding protein 1A
MVGPRKKGSKAKRSSIRGQPRRSRKASKKNWGMVKSALTWAATTAVWGVVFLGGILAYYGHDLPDLDKAFGGPRKPTITLLAMDNSIIRTIGDLHATPIDVHQLPPPLINAVLATEDRRFYRHFGLDVIGLARAALVNLKAGRIVQGGSTITQQVVKNLFLTPERTFKRKVQELLLALWLEDKFNKDQILSIYLNRVYLGAGTFGVEAAARKYFGKSARELNVYQSAVLAGLLKAPSRYNPWHNPKLSEQRTAQVLLNMINAGYLNSEQAVLAKKGVNSTSLFSHRMAKKGRGAYFADWVLEQVPSYVSFGNRDLVVKTTLTSGLQGLAEDVFQSQDSEQKKTSQIAFVAMTPEGAVSAMVGGKNYKKSQFNRATQALRQPGSAFKPVIYLAALEAGMGPETKLLDRPVNVEGWSPENFAGDYRGEVTLAEAMAKSINTIAVTLAEKVGRKKVVETARRLGITSDLRPTPSLALGAGEVSLLELTAVYGSFANGGLGIWPYGIRSISDGEGRILYERQGSGPGRVMKFDHAASMNEMLAGVVKRGTGRKASFAWPIAGKTGTSQNFRDAWFIGYSADLVAGVWMGNDNDKPMNAVTGGGAPAKLWRRFMKPAHEKVSVRPLPGQDGRYASSNFFGDLFGEKKMGED